MYEYRVRVIREGDGTDALEKAANFMGKQGWRLVSTSAATTRPLETVVWLFFERGTETRDRLEDAVATMDAGERRELMDVAVAQADDEPLIENV